MRIQPMSRPAGYGRDGDRGDRLGIRGFNPKLKAAATRLETLRTPEGEPNAKHIGRAQARSGAPVKKQIREPEQIRLQSLAQAPAKGPNVMVLVLARVIGRKYCHGPCGTGRGNCRPGRGLFRRRGHHTAGPRPAACPTAGVFPRRVSSVGEGNKPRRGDWKARRGRRRSA